MTPTELELRRRNEQKLAEAKERLGEKWILHPANRVPRRTPRAQPVAHSQAR